MPYTLEQLKQGIVAADAAGDTAGVQALGTEYRKMQSQQPEQPVPPNPATPTPTEPSFLERIKSGISSTPNMFTGTAAVVEPLLNQATGMVAKPIGEIAGVAAAVKDYVTGNKDGDPTGFKNYVQDKLTYEPKTEVGASEYNPLNAIPRAIGSAVDAVRPAESQNPFSVRGGFRNAVREAIPQAISILGMKYAPHINETAKNIARAGSEKLMASALKPTVKAWGNGDAAVAINTLLDKGINVTKGGVETLKANKDLLNEQIRNSVAGSTEKINIRNVAGPVLDKLNKFKMQVNPNADIASIRNSWAEFKNNPAFKGSDEISVQLAQDLKQGTYRQIGKKYGQLGSADIEAQKAIARGLKEEIAKKVPEISKFNEEETSLIKTLKVAERRVLMAANNNPLGLSLLAHSPVTWAAFMADKSGLFKSLVARMTNSSGEAIAKTTPVSQAVSTSIPSETDREIERQRRKQERASN